LPPIISLVTGTYNRINALKDMVASFRFSAGIGLPYEIVLVDGGSTDGTIAWCKAQPDVVLIEQGELLGAVKAFNAGFAVASGKYVLIGNDDILFRDESVQAAVAFLEDDDTVGIGCFYQDRDRKEGDYYVSGMGGLLNGKPVTVNYGQVCIVPRWLGDYVGWWGDYAFTYSGDNELSANVLEKGYQVLPVPNACIHDIRIDDELRKANKGDGKYVNGTHPDSAKWYAKWNQGTVVGPKISTKRFQLPPEEYQTKNRQLRLLYAPIYEPGNAIQHQTKHGLRDALAKKFLVTEVDYVSSPLLIYDVACMFQPDIILTQFHDTSVWNADMVAELRKEHPSARLINWNGDYFPENFLNSKYMTMMQKFDLTTFVTTDVAQQYDSWNIPWRYWQIGYEESKAKPLASTPKHDVLFLGNSHYSFRVALGKTLVNLRKEGINVGLYGDWDKSYRPNGYNLYNFDDGQRLYMNCKITVSDGRPHAAGFVSNRLFQALYSGALVCQQYFDGYEELLGLKDGKHLIIYHETEELPGLIRKWLADDKGRQKIAKAGQKFVIKNHSFDNRVEELSSWLAELR